jgi:hypothetical protein
MDIITIAISIISSGIVSSIVVGLVPKLWDGWSEAAKIKKEEKKLLNLLLYLFTSLHDSGKSLNEQFGEHQGSISFVTDYAEFYIDNLNVTYQQIESTLRELAKIDPVTAAGIRHSHFNHASQNLYILKKFVDSVSGWTKELSKENVIRELKSSREDINSSLGLLIEVARISMYIIASKIDKETLDNLSSTYPDEKLIAEFIKT